jgi:hypothetical protein
MIAFLILGLHMVVSPLSAGSSAHVDEGMGEAANVCCAFKARAKARLPIPSAGTMSRSAQRKVKVIYLHEIDVI